MPLLIGQSAPEFSLYDSQKQIVSLSDYNGKKLLILFFPFAFSSTCTKEVCAIRDSMGQYQALDTEIVGISVDALYTLAKFKEVEQLNFPLLSDFNRVASTAYDCLYDTFNYGMRHVSKRAAFVVDADGKIAYAEVLENSSDLPDFGKIKEVLVSISAPQ